MENKELKIKIKIFNSLQELPKSAQKCMENALRIKESAYAPYSNFRVGAAFLLENGEIVTGNNQENAAYPSGMCAERVAIWKAASNFPDVKFKLLAIAATSPSKILDKPVAPCGACRQTLSEYEIKQKEKIEVYFMGETGKIIKTESVLDLLPLAFDKSFL